MTLIRALAFLLHFTIVPIAVGRLITYRTKSKWIESYLIGFFGNLAIFYVLYSILEWRQNWKTIVDPVTGAFTALTSIYSGIILIALVVWSILRRDKIKKLPARIKFKIYGTKQKITDDKFSIIYILIVIALLLVQLYMAYAYEINEWSYDDYDYVVTSNDAISSDTVSYVNFIDGSMPNVSAKRAVASWGTYVAMVAKTSGFEVTTVYHTILPVFLLLIAYLNFYYIARFLFSKTDDRMIFLILLSMGYIFGLYSHYSGTFRLLGAIWQGKAVLSIIAVPFFTVYLFEQYKREYDKANLLPIVAVSLGACSITSQSLLFVVPIAIFVWALMCVYHKKICGIKYLLASLIGPIYLGIFYALICMLQYDMQMHEFKFFRFRVE
ncbi:DUF6077 domain-containing protein [Pseudobutyrivibrio sp. MD2005]|uniref:DUF6077 domain-containing protein n=1 Tax=Pseudobutyrivibrio sp. MD2005 TaxID=1410616 RepID=UPI0004829399|nr:DUF6077 domain-containing protein [Pseudobutyrivibrio sp. MD2005]